VPGRERRYIDGVIPRYSRPAMSALWSDEAKLQRWLDVELAALDGWAEVGAVPRDAVERIRERAVPPTPARVAEIEARTQHDVAAFVDAVGEQLGENGRWFHYGLTSSDVLDTALSLQIGDAGALLLEGVDRAFAAVAARAEEHRETLTIGRTHGVHAEPTTFGLKLAGWAFALERDRARLARALDGMRVGKLSGAVGTYAAADPEVERVACERLGLEPAPSSTQILQRDRHAEVLNALALLAASLERFALELRHLARTEVREVEEPFGSGQKGSSAMPHKRNPIVSERICGLARVVRATAVVGLENVALWHERDISHSSAERVVLPDAFLTVDYMLDRFSWLVEGLVVRTERMRENLDSSHRLYFSQRLLLALVEAGLARDEAYRLVQRHAMRAWDEGLDFPELVLADAEIAAVFDLGAYTRHVDVVFERLRALRSEHVHA
jgi:adenylosuccinate lyase